MEAGGERGSVLCGPDGVARVIERSDGRRQISVERSAGETFVSRSECTTSYPLKLIDLILGVKGSAWLCDEIEREERPSYLQHVLGWAIRAHFGEQALQGRRVTDFGCGSGASTMILARLFDHTQLVGVDIDAPALEIAEMRRRHYGWANIEFRQLPSPTELPGDLGSFDVIVFSAVFEHMLPDERKTMIPRIWSTLRPGGMLLVAETPHRYSPIETHTTGAMPLINYLPRRVVLPLAKRFSRKVWPTATWEQLLRAGIRGGSERELLRTHERAGFTDAVSSRTFAHPAVHDEFDLWCEISRVNELAGFKAILRTTLRGLRRATGVSSTPYLAFAVQRVAPATAGHDALRP